MSKIEGTWNLTQSVDGQTFPVDFTSEGGVTVGGPYFGAWIGTGDADQVRFAIAGPAANASSGGGNDSAPAGTNNESLTIYEGGIIGDHMAGISRSVAQGGKPSHGHWHAERKRA
jgi:hypothetical protein